MRKNLELEKDLAELASESATPLLLLSILRSAITSLISTALSNIYKPSINKRDHIYKKPTLQKKNYILCVCANIR